MRPADFLKLLAEHDATVAARLDDAALRFASVPADGLQHGELADLLRDLDAAGVSRADFAQRIEDVF